MMVYGMKEVVDDDKCCVDPVCEKEAVNFGTKGKHTAAEAEKMAERLWYCRRSGAWRPT